jgi:hypothetical protein
MLDVVRREFKYGITEYEAAALRRKLTFVAPPDPNNGLRGYLVRSLYFDTLLDADFEAKVDGIDKRRKIRLRVYDPLSETVKLELKQKEGGFQRKRSLTLSRAEAERMIAGDYGGLVDRAEPLARWLGALMIAGCYLPRVIVEYDREAYCRDINETRITFDSGLRATEANFNIFDEALITHPVCAPGQITLEVKYNRFLFSDIKDVLRMADREQISNSKYCAARAVTKRGRR